jgi:hypothetical protein
MKLNGFPFNGWDWSELAKAWNVYMPESYAGKDMYQYAERNRTDEEYRTRERTYTLINDDGTEDVKNWDDMFEGLDMNSQEHWDNHGYEDFEEWEPLVWYIRTALKQDKDGSGTRVTRKMANDVRAFCLALATDSNKYHEPIWRGMAQVEHDFTLLWFIIGTHPLLAEMWD